MANRKKSNLKIKDFNEESIEVKKHESEETNTDQIIGIVVNCLNLNIRKEPSIDSDVILVIPALSKLMIDLDNSTDDWLSVCTETGFEGFCMKKYVAYN